MRVMVSSASVEDILERAQAASEAVREGGRTFSSALNGRPGACALLGADPRPAPAAPDVVPVAERAREGRAVFVVKSAFVYIQEHAFDFAVIVPEGYETDFVSIPRAVRWLINPVGPRTRIASLVHDWLYAIGRRGARAERRAADRVFRIALRGCGVDVVRRWAMYLGVRLGGGRCFGANREYDERFFDLATAARLAPPPYAKDVMRALSVCPPLPSAEG